MAEVYATNPEQLTTRVRCGKGYPPLAFLVYGHRGYSKACRYCWQKGRRIMDVGGVVHYRCTTCGGWSPRDGFYALSPRLKSRCGIASECKSCSNRRRMEHERRTGRLRRCQRVRVAIEGSFR